MWRPVWSPCGVPGQRWWLTGHLASRTISTGYVGHLAQMMLLSGLAVFQVFGENPRPFRTARWAFWVPFVVRRVSGLAVRAR